MNRPPSDDPGHEQTTEEAAPPTPRRVGAVTRAVVLAQMQRLRDALERLDEDPEAIKAVRVSVRRTRAALDVLAQVDPDAAPGRRTHQGLKRLAGAFGQARDADILLRMIDEYAGTGPDAGGGLETLRARVARRRERATQKIEHTLGGASGRSLAARLRAWAERDEGGLSPRIDHAAGSLLWSRYENVLRYEELMPASNEVLHALRVECKRLRDTTDFFRDDLGNTRDVLKAVLVALQDCLGALQDTDVALATLTKLGARDSAPGFVAHLEARVAAILEEFPARWAAIVSPEFRRSLAMGIARL
jgi:CHAD domain-containing protein